MTKRKIRPKAKAALILAGLVIVTGIILIGLFTKTTVDKELIGNWKYGETTQYQFESNGQGKIITTNSTYSFSFSTEDSTLLLDFEDESLSDATYQYDIRDDELVLTGKEGTSGGQYTLFKD